VGGFPVGKKFLEVAVVGSLVIAGGVILAIVLGGRDDIRRAGFEAIENKRK
jgi:hypothetical protein